MKTKTSIKVRLFVTAGSKATIRAVENLRAVCEDPTVKSRYDIALEIIDVRESPQSAEEDKILVTPTLLKKLPLPVRRVVGDLSNREDVFVTLDLDLPRGDLKKANGNGD